MKVNGAVSAALPGGAVSDMDWVKLGTSYYLDPAVASLPDADTELLFVRGLAYAGAEETGGFIPEMIVPSLIRRRRHGAAVEALVARSLWVPASGDRGQPGYRIARWEDWQEELEALAQRRAADRERKRAERERKAVDNTAPGTRPRGRPPKEKPQVKNMSRDTSTGTSTDCPPYQSQNQNQSLQVEVGNQSSGRNARPREAPPALRAVTDLADVFGRRLDDDRLLKTVIDSIHARTRQVIGADLGRLIAADILGSAKGQVKDDAAYVKKAIVQEKDPAARWLKPAAEFQIPMLFGVPGGKPLPLHKPCGQQHEPGACLLGDTAGPEPGTAERGGAAARELLARRPSATEAS
jgi:hypothetical protein